MYYCSAFEEQIYLHFQYASTFVPRIQHGLTWLRLHSSIWDISDSVFGPLTVLILLCVFPYILWIITLIIAIFIKALSHQSGSTITFMSDVYSCKFSVWLLNSIFLLCMVTQLAGSQLIVHEVPCSSTSILMPTYCVSADKLIVTNLFNWQWWRHSIIFGSIGKVLNWTLTQ